MLCFEAEGYRKKEIALTFRDEWSRTSMCDHVSWETTYSKHQNLLSQSPEVGTFRKQPPLVSDRDHDHVSGWRFGNFPCKGLFDAVCSFLFTVWEKRLTTTWNYTYCNLEIACHKLSSIKKYVTDIFTEETPCGSILVNDHLLIFAFWVAAYFFSDLYLSALEQAKYGFP